MVRRSDRPTLAPAFDVAQFARDSERLVSASVQRPPASQSCDIASEVRILTRPQWEIPLTNEAWARTLTGTPKVIMEPEALKRLPLDHRAGFLMSLMDGALDLETLLELSTMDREEGLALLRHLFESGVVSFR